MRGGGRSPPALPLALTPLSGSPKADAAVPWAHALVQWPKAALEKMWHCPPASRRLDMRLHGSPLLLGGAKGKDKSSPGKGTPASVQTIRWWSHEAKSNEAASTPATSAPAALFAFKNAPEASVAVTPHSQLCVTAVAALCHRSVRVACPAHEEAVTMCLAPVPGPKPQPPTAPPKQEVPLLWWSAVILSTVVTGTYAIPMWRYCRMGHSKEKL